MDFEENRNSLRNALFKGNFDKAKEKIRDNLNLIGSNIKELQTYLFKIGSSSENKLSIEKADKNILVTGKIFQETYTLLKDYSEHKFNGRVEKIDNIKASKQLEDQCNRLKENFTDITAKIKRQDLALLETASRNSIRNSVRNSDFKPDQMNVVFMNGKDFLFNEVENREQSINIITKVMDQLNGLTQDQSKMVFQQAEMINSIESNTVEAKNNIERAVVDIKQADDANKSTGEWINKLIYIVIFIVILLLILSALMPK